MDKLAISHQAEGMTVKRLEEKSAEMSGRSMDEWRRAVLDKMQAGDKSMQAAGKFLGDKNWTGANPKVPADPGAFSQLVGNGYVGAHDGMPSSHAMTIRPSSSTRKTSRKRSTSRRKRWEKRSKTQSTRA